MGWLSEDPTYLAGGLVLVGVAMLIALRVTQQGRYLVRALVALAMAGAVVAIEHFWVTDNERIERTVYELRDAVQASDVGRVLALLAPDVEFVREGDTSSGELTREFIRSFLPTVKFDFVRVSHLETRAYPRSRRGSAEFRVVAGGSVHSSSMVTYNFGTLDSDWSLGFEEAGPGVWKVNRITPTRGARHLPGMGPRMGPGPDRGPGPGMGPGRGRGRGRRGPRYQSPTP